MVKVNEFAGCREGGMPRQAGLDAPGTLHHVIIRGIEKRRIVDDDEDRKRFISRLGDLAADTTLEPSKSNFLSP